MIRSDGDCSNHIVLENTWNEHYSLYWKHLSLSYELVNVSKILFKRHRNHQMLFLFSRFSLDKEIQQIITYYAFK